MLPPHYLPPRPVLKMMVESWSRLLSRNPAQSRFGSLHSVFSRYTCASIGVLALSVLACATTGRGARSEPLDTAGGAPQTA